MKLQELEKQRAVLEERERISKDIHDDLGSGLSKISILSELAKQTAISDEFTQRQLDKISQSSHELIDNLSELIWSHNPANDSLIKLFSYIREHLSAVFDMTEISFHISTPDLLEDREVPSVWRRNIFLAIKESLHNVLKHASATEVLLSISIHDHTMEVLISDNGKGFDPEIKTGSGNGLVNIQKRIADCGGQVHFDSRPNAGTKVHIRVPIDF
jgi:signal transduction histidine kinase